MVFVMFVHPYSKLYRDRKFAEQVRDELLARGRFSCDKSGTLTFNVQDGRVFKVTLAPASDFGRFVSATLELSVALPQVRRALHVLLGQVAEARHAAMAAKGAVAHNQIEIRDDPEPPAYISPVQADGHPRELSHAVAGNHSDSDLRQ